MASSQARVLWLKVWALAAVQGAIVLTWVIYNLYLLDLLRRFGFPDALAVLLLIIENALAAVMEPLMGSLSDGTQRWMGSQFPLIALGLILASGCFIGIPAVVIFGNASIRWLLPIVLVAWALAMTVFRSPALSLLGRYAFATDLPQAASILTLVGGVAGALGPLASTWILSLGPAITFATGSFVLLAAAAALRLVNPSVGLSENTPTPLDKQPISWTGLGFIFGTGFGVALGFRCLMTGFPKLVTAQMPPDGPTGLVVGLIFIAIALVAIPGGQLARDLGNRLTMIVGLLILGGLGFLAGQMNSITAAALIALAFGASFSIVSNGTIPFALSLVPPQKAGLGTGMYFSGGAVSSALFGAFRDTTATLAPSLIVGLGGLFFILASACIAGSPKKLAKP